MLRDTLVGDAVHGVPKTMLHYRDCPFSGGVTPLPQQHSCTHTEKISLATKKESMGLDKMPPFLYNIDTLP